MDNFENKRNKRKILVIITSLLLAAGLTTGIVNVVGSRNNLKSDLENESIETPSDVNVDENLFPNLDPDGFITRPTPEGFNPDWSDVAVNDENYDVPGIGYHPPAPSNNPDFYPGGSNNNGTQAPDINLPVIDEENYFIVNKNDDNSYSYSCNNEEIAKGQPSKITIPSKTIVDGVLVPVTSIKSTASSCGSLGSSVTEIEFEEGITEIGEWSFSVNTVEKVTFPSTLKVIRTRAFNRLTSLKEIYLPKSVELIELEAFAATCLLDYVEFEDSANLVMENRIFFNTVSWCGNAPSAKTTVMKNLKEEYRNSTTLGRNNFDFID